MLTLLPSAEQEPRQLHLAMHYVINNGGKRVRPLLAYATGKIFSAQPSSLDPVAAAVELIHCYSLVHDDLPAMDDDDLRRGKATCHKAFDEATAILAGDALQSLAFETLLATENPICAQPKRLTEVLRVLSQACGSAGMVGGQAMDLAAEGEEVSLSELKRIHQHKTGALIHATVVMAAVASGANQTQQGALSAFAKAIGIAFQIQDDIIDIESDTETLGKPQGADEARGKSTYPQLLGIEGSKRHVHAYFQEAQSELSIFGKEADLLRELSAFIVRRDN